MKVWKCIPEFDDLYMISNSGELKRVKTQTGKSIDRLLAPFTGRGGVVIYNLCKDGIQCKRLASRLVASAHIRNVEDFEIVIHKDGDIANNNVDNLEIATQLYLHTKLINRNHLEPSNLKPVYCVELCKRYDSIKSASEDLKLDYAYLRHRLLENKPCHGYTFIRLEPTTA